MAVQYSITGRWDGAPSDERKLDYNDVFKSVEFELCTIEMAQVLPAIGRFGEGAANLLFPPACAFCARELDDQRAHRALCDSCTHTLAPIGERRCPRCGLRIPAGLLRAADCEQCRGTRQAFELVWSLGEYADLLRRATLRTKRATGQVLASALSRLCVERFASELRDWRPTMIVPTPLHWLRRLWRGANGPETIAEVLSKELQVPCETFGVRRRRFTRLQAGLPPRERRKNVRGAFRASKHCDFSQARVLLVDDILTTGATLGELAHMVREAGASAVAVLVLARASQP